VGGSVPATEHSVMCMGTKDNEIATFERLIEKYIHQELFLSFQILGIFGK